ncbi:MAG: pimeloyl-ACP methyl ester esterase BioH [Methylococcaceae bacterium]|jgi:pimeloyl-[acyl-carrier protein] methyl ester esterase
MASRGSVYCETLGSGPDLVMLHGWAMHGGLWRSFGEALAAHWRVTLVDLPGHGLSAPQPDYRLDAVVDTLLQAAPRRAHWLGWSLGGLLGLRVAECHPERIASLMLIGSTPRFTAADHWPGMSHQSLAAMAIDLETDFQGTLRRFVGLQTFGQEGARALARQIEADLAERPPPDSAALRGGLNLLQTVDLRPALASLAIPVLAVLGSRDRLVPKTLSAALVELNPTIKIHALPRAAHVPFLTESAETLGLIEAFLARETGREVGV